MSLLLLWWDTRGHICYESRWIIGYRNLDGNQINGSLPNWLNLRNLDYMWDLYLSEKENPLITRTCTTIKRHLSSIGFRSLQSNGISGPLPEWPNLSNLSSMWALLIFVVSFRWMDIHRFVSDTCKATRLTDLFQNGSVWPTYRSCESTHSLWALHTRDTTDRELAGD